jgi:formylglycine-generating enzyme required for sulfatase activity
MRGVFSRRWDIQEGAYSMTDGRESEFPEIPGYRVVRLLGRGGWGIVYEAIQERINRRVALKLLWPQPVASWAERVQREARVTARLRHPNIVTIYDADWVGERFYLAMELVEGGTLADRIERGPLSFEESVPILISIGEALDYAHRKDVIHRDVKPQNIMFRDDGTAVLTDFGIAREREGARLTVAGFLIGTPEYMSPQVLAQQPADASSDLYSLGIVLFEMLTGDVPFEADSTIQLTELHRRAPIPKRPEIEDVWPILTRLLAKEPSKRYPSAAALVADLRVLHHEPAVPGPPPPPLWPQAIRWALLALIAVAAIYPLLMLSLAPQSFCSFFGSGAAGAQLGAVADMALRTAARMRPESVCVDIAAKHFSASARERLSEILRWDDPTRQDTELRVLLADLNDFPAPVQNRRDVVRVGTDIERVLERLALIERALQEFSAELDEARHEKHLDERRRRLEALDSRLNEAQEWLSEDPRIQALRSVVAAALARLELPKMVDIAGGCFQMGSPTIEDDRYADERRHRVCVESYRLGEREVTVKQFRKFVEATGYQTDAEQKAGGQTGCWAYDAQEKNKPWNYRDWASWRKPHKEQKTRDDQPVTCVSWYDAKSYVDWLSHASKTSVRLPTEAEWEYAARAETPGARFWGSHKSCEFANVADVGNGWNKKGSFPCDDGYRWVAPVGQYKKNPWGLYDILGNVAEWTCSEYDEEYNGREKLCTDEHGIVPRVLRGGSWSTGPKQVRAAYRDRNFAHERYSFVGFRIAADRDPTDPSR